jgi:hypothetical protein
MMQSIVLQDFRTDKICQTKALLRQLSAEPFGSGLGFAKGNRTVVSTMVMDRA